MIIFFRPPKPPSRKFGGFGPSGSGPSPPPMGGCGCGWQVYLKKLIEIGD